MANLTAVISITDNPAQPIPSTTEISFDVTRGFADGTVYWVYNHCWADDGKLLSTEAYPVLWPSPDSLTGSTAPTYMYTLSGTHGQAFVTAKPWSARPLKGATVDYLIG